MMRLSHDFAFSAAHHLPRYEGRCSRPHGHNYKLRVTLEGAPDPESGMIMDFYALQDVVQSRVLEAVDHRDLNEILENPTAELIVVWIWERLREALPAMVELTLWEVDECFVTYRGEPAR